MQFFSAATVLATLVSLGFVQAGLLHRQSQIGTHLDAQFNCYDITCNVDYKGDEDCKKNGCARGCDPDANKCYWKDGEHGNDGN
ncbi:hypothetical protein TI39_contig4225g00007 [Zymoseptoria brevis]|uniref:Uncharacterized protein n=1 Tax=Zymoseptoria brevis TaxID=1047168 RepID=A0A0F4G9J1_9PEZI|nr:hypothetical protein TI39_contig4225g00007 [Zymoseptoria brevis]